MTNLVRDVADAFAKVTAGAPDALSDERGQPAVLAVPLDGGYSAEIAWNEGAGGWSVSVLRPSDPGRAAEEDVALAGLMAATVRLGLAPGPALSLGPDGEFSLTTVIFGTATADQLRHILEQSVSLIDAAFRPGRGGEPEPIIGGDWIRI